MGRLLYRCLLRLHPRGFRQHYGQEMLWIFDQEAKQRKAVALFGDALASLVRQWALRSPAPVTAAEPQFAGTPAFHTFDSSRPQTAALVNGVILSIASFSLVSFAINHAGSQPRPVAEFVVAHGQGPSISAPVPTGRGHKAVSALGALLAWFAAEGEAQETPKPVVIGERLEIRSNILNETRPFIVSMPPDANRSPALYLLDGDWHFHHTSGIVSFLADSGRIPEMLVVAIPNTNRTRDLTPLTENTNDMRWPPGGGGADRFLLFLSDELIPHLEENYRAGPYRVLVGHSFGGLFAIHALTTRPEVFDAYIAIDPSLHWNDQATVAQAEAFFEATPELKADLYIAATAEGGAALGAVYKLAAVLEEKAPKGFRWTLRILPEENHISIPHRSTYLGLDEIFASWHLTDPYSLYSKGALEAVHRHFREGGERFGFERKTSAFTISMIVAGLIREGQLEEAASVLLHDPETYPPPWNQLDALARAYAKRGETEQVIRYYKLSLEENPGNEWARQKLTELGVKQIR